MYHDIDQKNERVQTLLPLPSAADARLQDWLRVELTYSSNGVAGSTLTRKETAAILNGDLVVAGKSLHEHFEVINHAACWDWVKQRSASKVPPSEADLAEMH